MGRKKPIQRREKKISCDPLCRSKCQTKITEIERDMIRENFWALGDITKQRQTITFWVFKNEKKN